MDHRKRLSQPNGRRQDDALYFFLSLFLSLSLSPSLSLYLSLFLNTALRLQSALSFVSLYAFFNISCSTLDRPQCDHTRVWVDLQLALDAARPARLVMCLFKLSATLSPSSDSL